MLDFIFKYWLEILFTIVSSGIIYMFKEYIGIKNGLKALLRNEIVRTYENYSRLQFCPNYIKENTNLIYENYHALGGNGFISNLVNEIYELPSEERC